MRLSIPGIYQALYLLFVYVYRKPLYVSCHMHVKVLYCSLYFVHISDA